MSYTDPANFSVAEMRDELLRVKESHYSAPKGEEDHYDYETFEEMVNLFASDDFYKLNRVATAYLTFRTEEMRTADQKLS